MNFRTLPLTATMLALLSVPALAQRHLWLVPGTAGLPFEGVRWDRARGRIIAASGDTILAIDPVSGARTELHHTRPKAGGPAGPGPGVLELVLDPSGAIDFTQSGADPDHSDGRIRRLHPNGQVQVIAGRGDEGPFVGEAKDALEARFHPAGLASGPNGERYLGDPDSGRVLLLEPRTGGGFSLRVLAGAGAGPDGADSGWDSDEDDRDGDGHLALEFVHFAGAAPNPDPLRARIKPRAVAAGPDGTVYLANWANDESQADRPPWVYEINQDDGEPGGVFRRLPVPGMAACEAPPVQDGYPVRKPHRLAVDEEGRLYVLCHNLVWCATPLEPDAADEGDEGDEGDDPGLRWHWEVLAGPLSPKEIVDAWPPQGAPGDQLDPSVLRRIRHLDAVPGGGLLLSDGVDGIRFLGPPGDDELGARLRAHARARTAGDGAGALKVLAGLERQRDASPGELGRLPFRGLCRAGTLSSRLDRDVLGLIGSFLAPSRMLAFRAGMAAQALRAGGEPGPDSIERILAQRHAWQVPGTQGTRFKALTWDPRTGTLVAASGAELRRLDPARGASAVLCILPLTEAAAASGADRPRRLDPDVLYISLAAGPDGAIDCAFEPVRGRADQGCQVWRYAGQGGLRLVAGRGAGTDPELAMDGESLAAGPAGERYAADRERGRILQLTPGGEGQPYKVRPLTENLKHDYSRIAAGDRGELFLGGHHWRLGRLLPGPERTWRLERIPKPGTRRCAGVYDPLRGPEYSVDGILALAPRGDGGLYVADEGYLWALTPEPGPGAAPRWHAQIITVSDRNALPEGAWDRWRGNPSLPIAPQAQTFVETMAGVPGGGLALAGLGLDGICFIGPPGDGALFAQVEAFREAEAEQDWPTARRILGALLRQRRMAGAETCEMPFLALARSGPGGAPPPLGRKPRQLPRQLQRLVGSFLVRPLVPAFRAGLAAEAILAESAWARRWVAAGCPEEEAAAADSEPVAQGAKHQRTEP